VLLPVTPLLLDEKNNTTTTEAIAKEIDKGIFTIIAKTN
jgi:hypothetical protein